MKITVVNDWLDPEFCDHLAHEILFNVPHIYGTTSDYKHDTYRMFYSAEFEENSFHVKYMCRKLSREVLQQDCMFLRVYANIQFKGMDGSFHKDDGDFTIIYMITPTLEDSGHFEYKDNGAIKKIDFIQNRLVWFEGGSVDHRGLSPNTDLPRVTLAFKVNKKE